MRYSIKQNHPIFKSANTVNIDGTIYIFPENSYHSCKVALENHLDNSSNFKLKTLEQEIFELDN